MLAQDDVYSLPMNNLPISAGTLHFQAWFRDPAALGSGFNLSDGLVIAFGP